MYIIFPPRNDYSYLPLLDLNLENNCIVVKDFSNKVFNFINLAHTSLKANQYISLPFQSIWYKFYFDKKINERLIFVFFEGNRLAYSIQYKKYLKSCYPDSIFVFRFVNVANIIKKNYFSYVIQNYDLILSFDGNDCKKYGWIEHHNTYGKVNLHNNFFNVKSDIFFVGKDKGRKNELRRIYKELSANGLLCDFYISQKQNGKQEIQDIHYIKKMPYKETIKKIQECRCLLEIVQSGQSGSTLRALEAVTYDKLLITNNELIEKEDFYDERYMFVYKKVEDITQWLLQNKNIEVRYKNKEKISNLSLIRCIEEAVNRKKD